MFKCFTQWRAPVAAVLLFVTFSTQASGPSLSRDKSGLLSESEFLDPPIAARPGAFWPWLNGHVSLERITYELQEMKAKGMSGADIWDVRANADPDKVVPIGPPFLGEESLAAIAHTIREADRLGLRMGMIAASGWNAGGTWVAPEDAGMGLFHSETTVEGPSKHSQLLPLPAVPPDAPRDAEGRPLYWKDVAVLAVPKGSKPAVAQVKTIVDLRDHLDASGKLTWNVPAGNWVILRFIMANTGYKLVVPSPNSAGPMIDFLNPSSTRKHFKHIVDRLESKLGKLQNSSFKYLEVDSMELGDSVPWTESILEKFQKQHGYDPHPYLPALKGWTVDDGNISERFLADWRKTISDVFIESHYRTGRALLNEHGLQLCAEAGGPGKPIWNSCPVEALKALGTVDILRGEFWPKHRNLWLVKEVSSAAHGYGKRIVDAESFTSWRHWQDGPYYLKQLADNALGEGLNHFTFHTFTHSPSEAGLPGFAYHAGTHINPNITWWPMARAFIDYLSRCCVLLQKGRFVADVCFYYGDDAPNFVPSKHAEFSPGTGYDYDVVNSDIILNRMTVRKGRLVLPDGMSYAMLVLPKREDMDLRVLQKLGALIRAGATVAGPKPTRTGTLVDYPRRDRQVAQLANEIWGRCDGATTKENTLGKGRVVWNRPPAEILAAKGLKPDFSFTGTDGRTRLDYVHRQTEKEDIYFVSNRNERWEEVECVFRVKGRRPRLWHPETGRVSDLHVYEESDAGTRVPLHLAPAESVFIVFQQTRPQAHFTKLDVLNTQPRGTKPALLSHSATPAGPMWLSDGTQSVARQFISFDLGTPRALKKIRIWNYNENVRGYINYGVKELDILVSADPATFRKCASVTLKIAGENEDKDYSQDFVVEAPDVRYVRFEVKSNQDQPQFLEGISQRAGLSKVKFFGSREEAVAGVRIQTVSSGAAFDPAAEDDPGNLHPAAEIATRADRPLLRAWEPGTFVLRDGRGRSTRIEVGTVNRPFDIAGPWQVQFPPGWGAPETNTFDQLVSWTDRPEEDIKYFSGVAVYKKTFEISNEYLAAGSRLELDLGIVQQVARVSLNGKPLGTLWKPPYSLVVDGAIQPGRNELIVEVANNWKNRLLGDAGLPANKRFTRTNLQNRFSRTEQDLQVSGLLGPVRILSAKEVAIP